MEQTRLSEMTDVVCQARCKPLLTLLKPNTRRRRRRDSTRRRCVLNSQLVDDGFGREVEN